MPVALQSICDLRAVPSTVTATRAVVNAPTQTWSRGPGGEGGESAICGSQPELSEVDWRSGPPADAAPWPRKPLCNGEVVFACVALCLLPLRGLDFKSPV